MGSSNKSSVIEATSADKVEAGYGDMPMVSKLGGTDADEHEMRMLGKTQQLNVSSNNSNPSGWSLTP